MNQKIRVITKDIVELFQHLVLLATSIYGVYALGIKIQPKFADFIFIKLLVCTMIVYTSILITIEFINLKVPKCD